MQKIINLLEQHVQWVAIGLGALFAIYMTWAYVLQSPVQETIGNESFGPGEIAAYTRTRVADVVDRKINSSTAIRLSVPQPAQQFRRRMAWADVPADATLAGGWTYIPSEAPTDKPAPGAPGPNAAANGAQPPGGAAPAPAPGADVIVQAMPVLPKAQPSDARTGRSVVLPPSAGGQANAAPPPPAAPGQAQPLPPGAVDKDWVTQSFKLPLADIAAAMKAANMVKEPFNRTAFVTVEVVREEVRSDGSTGPQTPVQPLGVFWSGQAPNAPWPGPNGSKPDQLTYVAWAVQNTRDVIEPPFFQVVKGDNWVPPGSPAVDPNVPFNPALFKGNLNDLTPEQKKQVLDYRQAEKKRQAEERKSKARSGPRTPTPRGGGPMDMGGPPMPAPRDTARPAPPPRTPRPMDMPMGGPPPIDMPMGGPGDMPGGMGPGAAPAAPNLPQPGTDFPMGDFDPAAFPAKEPITIWVHDIDVQPGKVYRYKMIYRLKNPIFGVQGKIAKDPAWADQVTIASPESDWSKPVTVPAITNFFIASGVNLGVDMVNFEIFTWKEGRQYSEKFKLQPGDTVGASKGETDYTTNWTFVGVQRDPRNPGEPVILLVDKDGTLITRTFKSDSSDPLYKTLREQVVLAKQAEASASGGPNTGVNPGP